MGETFGLLPYAHRSFGAARQVCLENGGMTSMSSALPGKPIDPFQLNKVLHFVESFWFTIVAPARGIQ